MTGTTNLSIDQYRAIDRVISSRGEDVWKIIVRPVTKQPGQALSVTLHTMDNNGTPTGTTWYVIERDGSVSSSELDD